ncbi:MAG: hypothetical protein P9L93_00320 [Candidatus Gorgyraea atricola]|nr:hypothetical protein [Candidatus Gorgyraea atricola]
MRRFFIALAIIIVIITIYSLGKMSKTTEPAKSNLETREASYYSVIDE